jgi:carbon-monoxide dehydrogenase medium subunit
MSMYATSFQYHAPLTIDEAVHLLAHHGDEAKIIAGGHSLIPLMKLRFAQPAHLVDVRRIPGLTEIRESAGTISIGARVTHRTVERSELVARQLPALSDAAALIGDPLVRNRGTIGGSLAHADPSADLPAVMLAYDAEFTAVGPAGARSLHAADFVIGLMTTTLQPEELRTESRIAAPPPRSGGAYEKHPHPASRFAIVGVAAVVTLDASGRAETARVGITGVGPAASRATGVEQALTGKVPDAAVIAEAAGRITEGLDVRGDLQGSAEYKRHLASVHARRAIERAVERARGS